MLGTPQSAATPSQRRFPLPPGEGKGEGGKACPYSLASLTPALSQRERAQNASPGTTAQHADAYPVTREVAPRCPYDSDTPHRMLPSDVS
jgi:hypothetical protein